MANDQNDGPLTGWSGDTGSLIAEMKRRAGVTTDTKLARYLGVAQSTLAYWRNRNQVPEAALLRAERTLRMGGDVVASRLLAARMIVFRLPEFWSQKAAAGGLKGGRSIFYRRVATEFTTILNTAYEHLADFERETGQSALDLAPQLLEDDKFMQDLVEFAKALPSDDVAAERQD